MAFRRRPPRFRWLTSRPSSQIHLPTSPPPASHLAAQSMQSRKILSAELPTALRWIAHLSEGASGVHTPPSKLAASPISPATSSTSSSVSLDTPADASSPSSVAGADPPPTYFAVVTHSPQSIDSHPQPWVQVRASVSAPYGVTPESDRLSGLRLHPLESALTCYRAQNDRMGILYTVQGSILSSFNFVIDLSHFRLRMNQIAVDTARKSW